MLGSNPRDSDLTFLGCSLGIRNFLILPVVSKVENLCRIVSLTGQLNQQIRLKYHNCLWKNKESKSLERWECWSGSIIYNLPKHLHAVPYLVPLQKIHIMFSQLKNALVRESSTVGNSKDADQGGCCCGTGT